MMLKPEYEIPIDSASQLLQTKKVVTSLYTALRNHNRIVY